MKNIYSVSQVNAYIKSLMSEDYFLNQIYVRGEVSNCKYHPSGHIYFTLKDHQGAIGCVMFASARRGLAFAMREGMQVIIYGYVGVYERDGRYQLYAREIERVGEGELYREYEKLKRFLKQKGYFDKAHKKPIPRYARRIGIVTASSGAAIQDIINVSRRRDPGIQLILSPAKVQGEGAAASVAAAIRRLDQSGVDVMIVGRGGGSLEELWAFNEEAVARAVYECHTPVISAVGHETDVTLIDFVADMRAPTPSAAAELAVTDMTEIQKRIDDREESLRRQMIYKLDRYRQRLALCRLRLGHQSPRSRIDDYRQRLADHEITLREGMKRQLERRRQRLALYCERLGGLSPLKQLERGYSVVTDEVGRTISSVEQIRVDQDIHIRMTDGKLKARICGIEPEKTEQDK